MKIIRIILFALLLMNSGIINPAAAPAAEQPPIQPPTFAQLLTAFKLPTFVKGIADRNEEYLFIANNFGNKTVNLCVLHALAQQLNNTVLKKSTYKMRVPEFTAIAHGAIKAYLDSTFDLGTAWQQFVSEQQGKAELSEQARTTLTKIRQEIRKAFADKQQIPPTVLAELEPFLKTFAASLLMVRSTGSEDRIDIANAGGNESVPSVASKIDAVWQAMGIVVESYFSEKSLRQRLLATDDITQPFFIPVLIQRMVGERTWTGADPEIATIPISGVMFTREAEASTPGITIIQSAYGHNQGIVNSLVSVDSYFVGSSYYIHPIIRKKMQRLVTIQKDLELVANPVILQTQPSLYPVHVTDLKHIADAVEKTYNFPMDIEFVVKIDEKIIYLVQARPIVSKVQKEPDYIADEYIESLKKESAQGASSIVLGESLGVAGGYVRTITSSDQVIITAALPQALNEYHDNTDRKNIKAVIVSKMAPATSHEATQFRGYNVPILVLNADATKTVEQWLKAGGTLLIDTQRGLAIHSPSQEEKELAAPIKSGWYSHPIPAQASIIANFVVPRELPFKRDYGAYKKELVGQKITADNPEQSMSFLVDEIKKTDDRALVLKNLQRILRRVITSVLVTSKRAVVKIDKQESKRLLDYIQVCAAEILYQIDKANGDQDRLLKLYPIRFLEAALFQQCDDQIIQCNSYVQFLKTIKSEVKALKKVTAGLPKKEKEEIIPVVGKATIRDEVQLIKADVLALNDTIGSQWDSFIKSLLKEVETASSPQEQLKTKAVIRKLSADVAQLQKLDVLDLWMNTSFAKQVRAGQEGLPLAQKLIDEIEGTKWREDVAAQGLPQQLIGKIQESPEEQEQNENQISTEEVTRWVADKKSILDTWERKINEWGQPEKFNILIKQFNDQFIKEFISGTSPEDQQSFNEILFDGVQIPKLAWGLLSDFSLKQGPITQRFFAGTPLGKLVMIRFMQQVIDLYDRTIKALTGSPNYQKRELEQAQRFKELLVPYYSLMKEMLPLIESKEQLSGRDFNLNQYIEFIDGIFNKNLMNITSSLLRGSKEFDVNSAQLGSSALITRSRPHTFEDIFTLAHQNMLNILGVLSKENGVKQDILPQLPHKISEAIESMPKRYPNLIGIDYHFPELRIYYNLPLANHSASLEIKYNKTKPERALLFVRFFGNGAQRMQAVAAYANVAAYASQLAFDTYPMASSTTKLGSILDERGQIVDTASTTEFSLVIDTKTDLPEIIKYVLLLDEVVSQGGKYFEPTKALERVNAIKAFLPENIVTIFASVDKRRDWNLERLSDGELKSLMDQLEKMLFTKEFDERELYFIGWIVSQRVRLKEYESALKLIDLAIHRIEKDSKFFTEMQVPEFEVKYLLPYLINQLTALLKIPEVSEQAWKTGNVLLSSKKAIHEMMNYDEMNRVKVIGLLSLFIDAMLSVKKDDQLYSAINTLINEPNFTKTIFKFDFPTTDRLLELIEQQKGKKFIDDYYKKIIDTLPEYTESQLYYSVLNLLKKVKGNPTLNKIAYDLSMRFIGEYPAVRNINSLSGIDTLAGLLKDAGQEKLSAEIIDLKSKKIEEEAARKKESEAPETVTEEEELDPEAKRWVEEYEARQAQLENVAEEQEQEKPEEEEVPQSVLLPFTPPNQWDD